jgi:hypothetical protein
MNLTTITKVITRKNKYFEEFLMYYGYHWFLACPKTTSGIQACYITEAIYKAYKKTQFSGSECFGILFFYMVSTTKYSSVE